ncbi:MAG TPA: SpoIID/LytB domain-containing protein [Solirubrobacteraceae bacterium]|nr:SpoIID/LytB domain-containing protein [Solirubrobacteraceae bacterium]
MGPRYHRVLVLLGAPARPSALPGRRAVDLALAAALLLAAAVSLAAALAVSPGLAALASPTPALVVRGAGDGHGVGMSQEGALGYAEHGYDYRAILAHYYTGTALGRVSPGRIVKVLVHGKVGRIPLESYVRGVVPAEVPSSWPLAALEAQAVASRTYALTTHAGGSRFDVYSDTRSQVYGGRAAETAPTNAAVAATAGQVVTYSGRPVTTYFFASSGGMTESVQNGFPGAAPEPWLVAVADPYDAGFLHAWTLTIGLPEASRRLRGLLRGSLRGIEVLRRGASPRILSAAILGSKGRTLLSGAELAARLGLYDTLAWFSLQGPHGLQPEPDRSGVPSSPASPAPVPGAPSGPSPSPGAPATPARVGPDGGTEGAPRPPVGREGGTAAG